MRKGRSICFLKETCAQRSGRPTRVTPEQLVLQCRGDNDPRRGPLAGLAGDAKLSNRPRGITRLGACEDRELAEVWGPEGCDQQCEVQLAVAERGTPHRLVLFGVFMKDLGDGQSMPSASSRMFPGWESN